MLYTVTSGQAVWEAVCIFAIKEKTGERTRVGGYPGVSLGSENQQAKRTHGIRDGP